MNKNRLRELLDDEIGSWSQKVFSDLVEELTDVVAYTRGEAADFHQFEIQILERERDFVTVIVSIDDGGFVRSFSPLTRCFTVHRDGRMEM